MNSPLYFPVALVHWESSNWISLSSHICLNRSGRISIKDWKNQSDEMVFSPLSLPFTVRTIHTSPVDYACLNVDPLTLLNVSGSSWSVHHCSAVSSLGASGGCSFLTASGFDLWSLFFFLLFFSSFLTCMSATLTVTAYDQIYLRLIHSTGAGVLFIRVWAGVVAGAGGQILESSFLFCFFCHGQKWCYESGFLLAWKTKTMSWKSLKFLELIIASIHVHVAMWFIISRHILIIWKYYEMCSEINETVPGAYIWPT